MILLTGGTGFVGSHVLKNLQRIEKDRDIVVGTRSKIQPTKDNCKIFQVDINKEHEVNRLPKDIDTIIHVAAFIPLNDTKDGFCFSNSVNTLGTYNLLEFATKNEVESFVYSSTVSVYKDPPKRLPITENHIKSPGSFYGISKYAAELLCDKYRNDVGLKTISLRYSSVYGNGQKRNSVLPSFLFKVLKDENPIIHGTGEYSQDFIYVKDVVKANILAMNSHKGGNYNIASGFSTKLIELAELIIDISGKNLKPVIDSSVSNTEHLYEYDISKAKKELKFYPDFDIKKGLEDYIENYSGLKNGNSSNI